MRAILVQACSAARVGHHDPRQEVWGLRLLLPGIVYPKVPPKVPSATLDLIRKHMSTPARTHPKGMECKSRQRGAK